MKLLDSQTRISCGNIFDDLSSRLFPICRSITGKGIRKTYDILSEYLPLERHSFKTGEKIFDWTIPKEWNIRDAYIKNSKGVKVVDFSKSNLHVVNYSRPVKMKLSLEELKPRLKYIPELPDAIPYVTSYYKEDWGFCMSYDDFIKLEDDEYEVFIDSSLKPGTLEIAEVILPGQSEEEIFFSTYCCHPSMANNELSGPIIAAMIYKTLSEAKNRRYTYRFYFGPETIGSLAYLKIRGNELKKNMKAGMILTCCGNSGGFTYKKLKKTGILDNAVEHVLKFIGKPYELIDFFPTGSDDRQYCSPGFNLPVGTLCRSMYGKYEYYHTSKDDLNFVTKSSMLESLDVFLKIIYVLEKDLKYKNLKPFGEPFFSKYGLQSSTGAARKGSDHVRKIKYILSFSDGFHSIMDIADKMGIPIWELETAINDLMKAELLCAE